MIDWQDTRLVVVDIETTRDHSHGFRVVDIAAITCQQGRITGRWASWVNPETDIDDESFAFHHLTEDLLQDQPTFEEIAPILTLLLTPKHGPCVIVAHQTGFDIPIIRSEYERFKIEMPDVAVLDTIDPIVHRLAGVTLQSRSLDSLCQKLNIERGTAHRAEDDAEACANAALILIDRASKRGATTIQDILNRTGNPSTLTVELSAPSAVRHNRGRTVPASHMTTHQSILPARPTASELKQWTAEVLECADYRCGLLAAKVETAQAPISTLAAVLDTVLRHTTRSAPTNSKAASTAAASTATILNAFSHVLDQLPSNSEHGSSRRRAVLDWYNQWAPTLTQLGRCGNNDQCPRCEEGDPCGLDMWQYHLAVRIKPIGSPKAKKPFQSFCNPTAKPGIGGYGTLVGDYPELADETLNLVLGELHAVGRHNLANRIARHAWDTLGGRGPHLAAHIARTLAPRGLFTEAAVYLDEAAKHIPSSTTPAYRQLKYLSDYYRSKLTRVDGIDSDGNPIISPVSRSRRAPLRSHPRRFTRPEPDTNP